MTWPLWVFLGVCAVYVVGAVRLYRSFLPELRTLKRLRKGRGALILKLWDGHKTVKHKIKLEDIEASDV